MEALVSGQTGRMVLIQGDMLKVFNIESQSEFAEFPATALKNLFPGVQDVRQISADSEENALKHLTREWQKDRALILTLMLLDPDEDPDIQRETPKILEPLVKSTEVCQFVAYRLFSWPMDDIGNLENALSLAENTEALLLLLKSVKAHQSGISQCRNAWEELEPVLFESDSQKTRLEEVAVDLGLFYNFAVAKTQSDITRFNDAKLQVLGNASFSQARNSREIIAKWLGSLTPKGKRKISEEDYIKIAKSDRDIAKSDRDQDLIAPAGTDRRFLDHDAYKKVIHDVYIKVTSEIDDIRLLFQKLQLHSARRSIDRLIQSQLSNDDKKYAVLSLCNLAKHAEDTFQHTFALELTKRAVEIAPEDARSWSQLANACIHLSRYDEAEDALNNAHVWGEEHFAANGKARILWRQNRLVEASKKFEEVISQFENDDRVWNSYFGLASVYREMNEIDNTLEILRGAIDRFPSKPLLRCGMASALRYIGQFDEAIQAFRDSNEKASSSVEAFFGIGNTYKDMGDLPSALEAFELAKMKYPKEPSPYLGIAEVRRAEGKHQDALLIYRLLQERFPFYYGGFRGTAETYRELGNFNKAEREFNEAIKRFPDEVVLQFRRAHLFKESHELERALQAYTQTLASFPNNGYAKSGQADLLKELGDIDAALSYYKELLSEPFYRFDAMVSMAAIYVTQGAYQKVLKLLPDNQPRTKSEWVANHIRGMALLKSGNLDKAIAHFESGLSQLRFASERPYFTNALAIAKIKQRKYEEALETLENIDEPVTHILRLHTFGALNDIPSAEFEYNSLINRCPVYVIPLRDELGAQLKFNDNSPAHDSNWIFNQECNALALSITQQQVA